MGFAKKSTAKSAYNSLAKYFGLRARDTFLNAFSDPVFAAAETTTVSNVDSLLEELFTEDKTFVSIDKIKDVEYQAADVETLGKL